MRLLVLTNIFDGIIYCKKGWARHYHKWTYVLMSSNRYNSQISIKVEFSQQIFDKFSWKHFQKVCPLGADMFHDEERNDGQGSRTN
jgi:hypothetical protein